MAVQVGQAKPGPVMRYQPCPHCGRKKLYDRAQIEVIFEHHADEMGNFACVNRECRQLIHITDPPEFRLVRARPSSSPPSGKMRRPSGRNDRPMVPSGSSSGLPALSGDQTITEPALPVQDLAEADTIAKHEEQVAERRRQIEKLKADILEAGRRQELFHGRYKLGEKAGSGVSGVVMVARDVQANIGVALKFHLDTAFDDDDAQLPRLRIDRAYGIQALFQSSHVVHPVDKFEHPRFGVVTVERYISGAALDMALKMQERLPEDQAIDISIQLAEILVEANTLHVVHRDIKPANILVQFRRGQSHVHLIDFGLARIRRPKGEGDAMMAGTAEFSQRDMRVRLGLRSKTRPRSQIEHLAVSLTQSKGVLGTPWYVSPEAIEGATADHRSDQYSLAATIYHIVTGQPPFDGVSSFEIMVNAICGNLEPAWVVAERNGNPIRKEFSDILMKALNRDPELRYQSPEEFLDDLKMLQHLPAKPQSSEQRLPSDAMRVPRYESRVLPWVLFVAALFMAIASYMNWIPRITPP